MIIFVDTNAWIAMWNSKDENYNSALKFKEILAKAGSHLLTTNYIMDETYTLLFHNVGYKETVRFKKEFDRLLGLGVVEEIIIDDAIEKISWDIFERFNMDKFWSFTDCTSKVIM